jgi:hypothetical protein
VLVWDGGPDEPTRYEKRAAHYLAMLTLAALRLWC